MYLDILPMLLIGFSFGTLLVFAWNFVTMAYKRLRYDVASIEVERYADRCYWQITASCILGWIAMSLLWGFDLFTFVGPCAVFCVAVILTYIASGGRKLFPTHPGNTPG